MFYTWTVSNSSPDTLLTFGNTDFLGVLADIVDVLVVVVNLFAGTSNVCVDELRLIAHFLWNTLIKADKSLGDNEVF